MPHYVWLPQQVPARLLFPPTATVTWQASACRVAELMPTLAVPTAASELLCCKHMHICLWGHSCWRVPGCRRCTPPSTSSTSPTAWRWRRCCTSCSCLSGGAGQQPLFVQHADALFMFLRAAAAGANILTRPCTDYWCKRICAFQHLQPLLATTSTATSPATCCHMNAASTNEHLQSCR